MDLDEWNSRRRRSGGVAKLKDKFMDEKKLYSISFDLEQKAIDKYYGKSRRNTYREVGKFFQKNGFEHVEGSVYHSMKGQTNADFVKMIISMGEQLPWIKNCVKEMHRTIIPADEIVDMKEILLATEKDMEI